MTQTVLQTITDAFQRIGVVDETASPTAAQTVNGLRILNNYMATQTRDGWRTGYFPQTGVAGVMPVRDSDLYDIETLLAQQIAINYGTQVKDPVLLKEFLEAERRMNKRYIRYFESDLSELSRAQGGPWGGAAGWW